MCTAHVCTRCLTQPSLLSRGQRALLHTSNHGPLSSARTPTPSACRRRWSRQPTQPWRTRRGSASSAASKHQTTCRIKSRTTFVLAQRRVPSACRRRWSRRPTQPWRMCREPASSAAHTKPRTNLDFARRRAPSACRRRLSRRPTQPWRTCRGPASSAASKHQITCHNKLRTTFIFARRRAPSACRRRWSRRPTQPWRTRRELCCTHQTTDHSCPRAGLCPQLAGAGGAGGQRSPGARAGSSAAHIKTRTNRVFARRRAPSACRRRWSRRPTQPWRTRRRPASTPRLCAACARSSRPQGSRWSRRRRSAGVRGVCACVCLCTQPHVHMCVCVCVCACVRGLVQACAHVGVYSPRAVGGARRPAGPTRVRCLVTWAHARSHRHAHRLARQ